MPRRRPTSNGHDDTIPIPITVEGGKRGSARPGSHRGKELVPIYRKGRDLDMAIFEREISRILNKMRVAGHRDEDTEPAILRAIATYEAAG